MKNLFVGLFLIAFTLTSAAQDNMKKDTFKVVSLEQTKGKFTQKSITLEEGTYVFEISNNNATPEVGFVLVEAGKDASNSKNHIKEAYVSKVVMRGKKESSKPVMLKKGVYKYFCPLNNTPQYTLVVE